MKRKNKAFTLVELLIVIIIIGILAGMMMLSTGSATDKAEAMKVVNNLRTIKSAVLMYYATTENGLLMPKIRQLTSGAILLLLRINILIQYQTVTMLTLPIKFTWGATELTQNRPLRTQQAQEKC